MHQWQVVSFEQHTLTAPQYLPKFASQANPFFVFGTAAECVSQQQYSPNMGDGHFVPSVVIMLVHGSFGKYPSMHFSADVVAGSVVVGVVGAKK